MTTGASADLTPALASAMARLAVENVAREYPNHPGHLLEGPADLVEPRRLHPAFFGSYDWHSAVHQHWLLVRLLRLGVLVDDPAAERAARAALTASLTGPHLATEAAYLAAHPSFERTYGWAWALALASEAAALAAHDREATAWSRAMDPLVAVVRALWLAYLPRATYPIRSGTHANSAFGLTLALDAARAADDRPFAEALEARARDWFLADRAYPAGLEPGGEDFLSPTLTEAALVARLLAPDAFAAWFAAFLPDPPATLLEPAVVADRSDARIAHLDGLAFARAWNWRRIAAALTDGGGNAAAPAAVARAAAERHLEDAESRIFSGDFVGEHWIATFALLAWERGSRGEAGDEGPVSAAR